MNNLNNAIKRMNDAIEELNSYYELFQNAKNIKEEKLNLEKTIIKMSKNKKIAIQKIDKLTNSIDSLLKESESIDR